VAVYRRPGDPAAAFSEAVAVFKDGVLVAREGEILAEPHGRTFFVEPPARRAPAGADPAAGAREHLETGAGIPLDDLLIEEEALARPEAVAPIAAAP
jgi:formylmethanofuran dehydrogenase subunit A